jgi:hypothetical protein
MDGRTRAEGRSQAGMLAPKHLIEEGYGIYELFIRLYSCLEATYGKLMGLNYALRPKLATKRIVAKSKELANSVSANTPKKLKYIR